MTQKQKLAFIATIIIAAMIPVAVFYELTLPEQNTLFQVSAFNVFSAGNFAGDTTYAELAKHGDFGIGTLNGLNGEMFATGGKFYQIPSDGHPREISSSEEAPYATVTFFKSSLTFPVANLSSYSVLATKINSTLTNYNAIYAIKVHGFFDYAKTRSVTIQTKPYPTLTEAVKNQTVFNLASVEGTMVGFFFPNCMEGIDAAGYHLHFLTDDYTAGGHVLDCAVNNATVEIDQINNYRLIIP